ncbi:hypothetical protein GCM10009101_31780 [Brevundimonas lenta]
MLPFAVAVAVSPLPIMAVAVLLMSPRARSTTPPFLLGWMAAIATALIGVAAVSRMNSGNEGAGHVAAVVKLLLGGGLVFLAWKEWRARPRRGEPALAPRWLQKIEQMGPLAACAAGFGIFLVNPKNLTVGIASGVLLGTMDLSVASAVPVIGTYVLIAASTVLVPVAAYFAMQDRIRPWLAEVRDWLTQNNAVVMAVVLLLVGAVMVGKGLSGFAAL